MWMIFGFEGESLTMEQEATKQGQQTPDHSVGSPTEYVWPNAEKRRRSNLDEQERTLAYEFYLL